MAVLAVAATAALLTISSGPAFGTPHRGATTAAGSAANTFSVSFAPDQPSKPSSLTMTLATAQQPATASITLPQGTVLNVNSAPMCSAPPACGPTTEVGAGKATITYSKYLIPLNFSLFNRPGGLALVISNPNGTPIVVEPTWSGTTLQLTYPNSYYRGLPISVSKISMHFNVLGSGKHAYIRTPAKCPKTGWSSATTLTWSNAPSAVLDATAKCTLTKKHAHHRHGKHRRRGKR